MTVAIALHTFEGVVIGTDSTVTFPGPDPAKPALLLHSAQKVFEIGPSRMPFVANEHFSGGIAFSGDGGFGPLSWRDVVNSFYREVVTHQPGMVDVGAAFLAFAKAEWQRLENEKLIPAAQPIPDSGFLIGAVGRATGSTQASHVQLRSSAVSQLPPGRLQVATGGELFCRLYKGYDVRLKAALAATGMDPAAFDALVADFEIKAPLAVLPLRDAIDLVHFLVYSTIKYHRFVSAFTMIGGAVEIAVITADRGFRWIVHKSLQDSIGIPRGGAVL